MRSAAGTFGCGGAEEAATTGAGATRAEVRAGWRGSAAGTGARAAAAGGKEPAEGSAGESALDVDIKIRPVRRDDQRRSVLAVFHPASQHFRQKVSGGVVDGADNREIPVAIAAEAEIPEPLAKDLFHFALGFHSPSRMIKEILVEREAGMLEPPGRMEDDFNGKRLVLKDGIPDAHLSVQRMRALAQSGSDSPRKLQSDSASSHRRNRDKGVT